MKGLTLCLFFTLFAVFFPFYTSPAQAQWGATYGGTEMDIAKSVYQTDDGGYIVAGTWSLEWEGGDIWVLKLDGNGNVIWQKTYGGESWDYGTFVRPTSDGGYIVTGNTWNSGESLFDFWVLKLDGNGKVTWQKSYGLPDSEDQVSAVEEIGSSWAVTFWPVGPIRRAPPMMCGY